MAHDPEDYAYEVETLDVTGGIRVIVTIMPRGEEAWVLFRNGGRFDYIQWARDSLDDTLIKEPPLDERQADEESPI